jgi:hypothetical protein
MGCPKQAIFSSKALQRVSRQQQFLATATGSYRYYNRVPVASQLLAANELLVLRTCSAGGAVASIPPSSSFVARARSSFYV